MHFLRAEPGVSAAFLLDDEEIRPVNIRRVLRRGFDGIVTTEFDDPHIARTLAAAEVPVVVVGTRVEQDATAHPSSVSFVSIDERELGKAGASHLLSLGNFRTFGFVPFTTPILSHVSALRRQSFTSELRRHGKRPDVFKGTTSAELEGWLLRLARPAAVLTAGVERGRAVLAACRKIGIRVPDELSVLTIGNSKTICESTIPALSGIDASMEEEGATALREVVRLAGGRGARRGRTIVSPTSARVVERRSTTAVPPATHVIERALAYIKDHAAGPLRVADVVRHLGISRRLVDLRFHEFHGLTINESILACRFALLKKRLAASDAPIGKVVAELGWRNFSSVSTAFASRFGMTMSDYRFSHRHIARPTPRAHGRA